MIKASNITGIILSGGKSSRMGSDKGLVEFQNKSFIQHSLDALSPLVSEIIIVSDNPGHDQFNCIRIEDLVKNAGPVSGIYSGLKASKTEYNIILSCDIPLIRTALLQKLINHIEEDFNIFQIESNGKSMPLIAIYKKECLTTFGYLLKQDERRLRVAVNNCKVKNIKTTIEEDIMTQNINTIEELKYITHASND